MGCRERGFYGLHFQSFHELFSMILISGLSKSGFWGSYHAVSKQQPFKEFGGEKGVF